MPPVEAPAADRIDVLVVDDDGAVAGLVTAVLQREGLVVRRAGDADAALATLERTVCRVLLTDYTMPGTNGLQLVRAVGARGWPTGCLVMSAFLEPAVLAELVEEPAVAGVLGKPFELATLVRDVRAVLAMAGLERDAGGQGGADAGGGPSC